MKIDKVYKVYGKHIDQLKPKDNKEKNKNMNIREEKSADVQISKSAKELVRQISESEDKGFSERVERIRQAVIDGKYKVSSEKIADKILDFIESGKDKEI